MTRLGPLLTTVLLVWTAHTAGQSTLATQLADLTALSAKMGATETRVRVDALHRVWTIAMSSPESEVKLKALGLLEDPVGSSSDHIRMPAVYAIAEIAGSSDDVQIKVRALRALAEPLRAGQVPIRDVAIDAVNAITRSASHPDVAMAAVQMLGEPLRSGNNGVRIPAINALIRAVQGKQSDQACGAALELLQAPLNSSAMIGGLEVRMMALRAVERIGLESTEVGTKAKAMGMLQLYAGKDGWEPEARRRAQEGAAAVQNSIKR